MILDTRQVEQTAQTIDVSEVEDIGTSEAYDYGRLVAKNERADAASLYLGEELDSQLDELTKIDPDNKNIYDAYKTHGYNRLIAERMLANGEISRDANGKIVVPPSMNTVFYSPSEGSYGALETESVTDSLANMLDFIDKKRKEHGLKGINELEADGKVRAKKEYELGRKKLADVDFFSLSGMGELSAGMVQAVQDPVNVTMTLATLPFGGAVTGSLLKKVGSSFLVGAGTGAVAEVPIQFSVYDWKNEIDVDWSVYDALAQGSINILTGGLIQGGGRAIIEVPKATLAKWKTSADPFEKMAARRYTTMTQGSAVKNTLDHIDLLHSVRVAREMGEDINIVEKFNLRPENMTTLGRELHQAELDGTPSLADLGKQSFDEQMVDERVLPHTDREEKPSAEFNEKLNHAVLDDMNIRNIGDNDMLYSRIEEAQRWADTKDGPTFTTVSRIDEAGNEIIETVDLKEFNSKIDNDIDGMNKFMECALG